MATWRKLIEQEMQRHGDSWNAIVHTATTDFIIDWDREFDPGYGSTNGDPFTLWTFDRVYFPCQYDGAEWVGSVPRWPCDEVTEHIGG